MTNFAPYVERRVRCHAFQFLDSMDAEFVARALYWDVKHWTLDSDDYTFTLNVMLPGDAVITVNRGDYLVRDPSTLVSVVVPPEEFYPAWEPEQ